MILVWIAMSDRAPADDGMKIVWAVAKNGVGSVNRAWYDGQTWHGSGSMAGVTHWMELPPSPEDSMTTFMPINNPNYSPFDLSSPYYYLCTKCGMIHDHLPMHCTRCRRMGAYKHEAT